MGQAQDDETKLNELKSFLLGNGSDITTGALDNTAIMQNLVRPYNATTGTDN
jgi:hypothetical protein